MNTMILLGMAVKISSICLLGMASSEGITYFHKNKLSLNKKQKSKQSSVHDFRRERGERENEHEIKPIFKKWD